LEYPAVLREAKQGSKDERRDSFGGEKWRVRIRLTMTGLSCWRPGNREMPSYREEFTAAYAGLPSEIFTDSNEIEIHALIRVTKPKE
jgi:hypothetical protein